MGAATVTIRAGLPGGPVTGKYVCASTLSLSYIDVGFVPSHIVVMNATDGDQFAWWSAEMPAGTAMKNVGGTQTKASSGAITTVAQTDGTHHGFSVGTDAGVQEAQKTFNFIAWR